MYRATTPTHTFVLSINTNTCKEILVSYRQGGVKLDKHYQDNTLPDGMTLDGKNVVIHLTQEETLMFDSKKFANAQVRVLTVDDQAYASQIFSVKVSPVLNEEVLA